MKIHGSNTVASAGARVALRAFGLELRNARIPVGLRQEDVASELGVSTQTVRNWESGRVEPGEENKQRLGELFGEQLGDFGVFYEDLHSQHPKPKDPNVNGGLLRAARKDAGLTQAQAAERVSVNRNSIVRYENGTSRPLPKILEKLSEIYGRSPDWFYGDGSTAHATRAGVHARELDATTPAGRARIALELAISEASDAAISHMVRCIGEARLFDRLSRPNSC